MSNIIPPLLSSSPPPMLSPLDDFDNDEFGDFNSAGDSSFDFDGIPFHTSTQEVQKHIDETPCPDESKLSIENNSELDWKKRIDISSTSLHIKDNKSLFHQTPKINSNESTNSVLNFPSQVDIEENINNTESAKKENAKLKNEQCDLNIDELSDFSNLEKETANNFNSYVTGETLKSNSESLRVFDEKHTSCQFKGSSCDTTNKNTIDIKSPSQEDVTVNYVETEEQNSFQTFNSYFKDTTEISSCSEILSKNIYENSVLSISDINKECQKENVVEAESNTYEENSRDATDLHVKGLENQEDDLKNMQESKKDIENVKKDSDEENMKNKIEESNKNCTINISVNTYKADDRGDCIELKEKLNNFQDTGDINTAENIHDDDFDEFADFSGYTATKSVPIDVPKINVTEIAPDEFDDFADFSTATNLTVNTIPDLFSNSFKVEEIDITIKNFFPVYEYEEPEFIEKIDMTEDPILKEVRDITETKALSYKWAKSSSQNFLLKALNIDMRNILYGPRWKETMPPFAATLGFTPLEPVKSGNPVIQQSGENVAPSSQNETVLDSESSEDIPSAQFDWNVAGLTNPLDYSNVGSVLLDFDHFTSSFDYPFVSPLIKFNPPLNSDDFKEWISPAVSQVNKSKGISKELKVFEEKDDSLKVRDNSCLKTGDNVSVNSLNFNEVITENELTFQVKENAEEEFGDFENFTSYQCPKHKNDINTKEVLLRESHISSQTPLEIKNNFSIEIEKNVEDLAWLKSTVVTPDTTRKDIKDLDLSDDFDDFQMSIPTLSNKNEPLNDIPSDMLKTIEENTLSLPSITSSEPLAPLPTITNYASLTPLQPISTKPNSTLQPKIEWPEPGITTDELNNIELAYKPKVIHESHIKEHQHKNEPEIKNEGKQNSKRTFEDDEDWSDFISSEPVKNITPTIKPVTSKPCEVAENPKPFNQVVSTAELQLSIPYLNHIQLPKRPTPVITPEGLYISGTNPSQTALQIAQAPHQHLPPRETFPDQKLPSDGFQPSFISNQYSKQVENLSFGYTNSHNTNTAFKQNSYTPNVVPTSNGTLGGFSGYYHQQLSSNMLLNRWNISSTANTLGQQTHFVSPQSQMNNGDDEEWSDFISSQPVTTPSTSNGWSTTQKLNADLSRSYHQPNWPATNIMPNIITNPVSFDSLQSYSMPNTNLEKNKGDTKGNGSNNTTSRGVFSFVSNSVPELDFVIPKNRTWKK